MTQPRPRAGVCTAMRSCALVLSLVACHGGAARAPAAAQRATLCAGLDDEACQDRALAQSICLIEPDHASCAPLRAGGDDSALQAAIDAAIALRPKGHDFQIERLSTPATERHMSVTGG